MASSRVFQIGFRVADSPWAILVAAVATRLAVFWQLLPEQGTHGFYRYNEQARIAWAIVSGYGFSSPWVNTPLLPTAQQPPLYPWLLAVIFKLAGPFTYTALWIAELFNMTFAALTAILIRRVGMQLFGQKIGILAGWVWACWLYEAVVCMRVWESSLSAFFVMLSVWIALHMEAKSACVHWISFGVLAGVSALTNTSLLSIFVGVWFWFFLKDRGLQQTSRLIISATFCVLALLPWTVRNYVEFHRLVPVRDNFGLELWQGNHAGLPDDTEYNRLGETRFMETKRNAAVEFIRENPPRFLWRCGGRFFRFWTDPNVVLWLPLSGLAWFGCVLTFRSKRRGAVILTIPMLLFPLVYYVTHAGTPYRHPIEPLMLLLSVFGVANVVHWVCETALA